MEKRLSPKIHEEFPPRSHDLVRLVGLTGIRLDDATLEFLDSVNTFNISTAYLFGSAVNGIPDTESDIDIAVVSKDFQGLPYEDIKKISKYRRKVDLRLEIHPFSLEEIKKDPPHFYLHIKNIGIKIQ